MVGVMLVLLRDTNGNTLGKAEFEFDGEPMLTEAHINDNGTMVLTVELYHPEDED